jgi:transcriptional antiterminator
MQIDIDQLEQALKTLIDELRKRKGNIINIEQPIDYYWSVTEEDLYNPYENPKELTLGQLSDDLQEMHKIAQKQTEPVSYNFVKMSSLMAMIGYKTVW